MRTLSTTLLFITAVTLSACSTPTFQLTETSAMDRLLSTDHVAHLQQNIPTRHLTCMVDRTEPDAIALYLGDDEGDHTTRIGFYPITSDGRVWVNADPTGLEDRWTEVH
jgi:hypothetical protein